MTLPKNKIVDSQSGALSLTGCNRDYKMDKPLISPTFFMNVITHPIPKVNDGLTVGVVNLC